MTSNDDHSSGTSLRVLSVLGSLHSSHGGPITVVRQLHPALEAAGITLGVVGPGEPDQAFAGTMHVHRLSPGGRFASLTRWPREIQQLFADPGYDLVFIHCLWEAAGHAGAIAARRAGIPYIVRSAGQFSPVALGTKRLKKAVFLRIGGASLFRSAAVLQILNPSEKAFPAKRFPEVPRAMLPNGIDLPDGPTPVDARPGPPWRMVTIGRLSDQKGLDLLLEAWGTVAAEAPNWELEIYGPPFQGLAYQQRLERQIAEGGPLPRVRLMGPVYGEDKLTVLRSAHLWVQPSRWEGSSMALLEAASYGLPTLYSTECFNADLAAAGGGEELPPTVPAITAALRDWLNRPLQALAFAGNAARACVADRFTWGVLATRYRDLFTRVLAGRPIVDE